MNRLLKSRRLYILFVLPFIVMAILFSGIWLVDLQPFSVEVQEKLFVSFPLPETMTGGMLFAGFILLYIAFFIFFFTNQYKLLEQQTALPALLFVLLGSVFAIHFSNIYWLLSIFLLTMALARLQTAINRLYTNAPLFDFGAFLMSAIIVSPQLCPLLLWALCVVAFSGRSTLRDFAALFIGLLLPVAFLVVWGFWTDTLGTFSERFLYLLWNGVWIENVSLLEWIRLVLLALLLFFAVLHIFARYAIMIMNQRRGLLSLISLSFFLLFIPLLFPVGYYESLFSLTLPLAVLYAHFFITNRIRWAVNLFFCLFLLACAIEYIMP